MQTTKVCLHLAGVVFREEAVALEQRLLAPVRWARMTPKAVALALTANAPASKPALGR